ncbi:hypothetical protein BLA29_013425, partial [Euroglyphus maynei]
MRRHVLADHPELNIGDSNPVSENIDFSEIQGTSRDFQAAEVDAPSTSTENIQILDEVEESQDPVFVVNDSETSSDDEESLNELDIIAIDEEELEEELDEGLILSDRVECDFLTKVKNTLSDPDYEFFEK